MSNPFRPIGRGSHKPGEWLAPEVGLVGRVEQFIEEDSPGGVAVIGPVGSGKTAALDRAARDCAERGARSAAVDYSALWRDGPPELASALVSHLQTVWGMAALEAAYQSQNFGDCPVTSLRRDELCRLIGALLSAAPGSVITLDEAHVLEDLVEVSGQRRATDELCRVAEAARSAGGYVYLALTREAWDRLGPQASGRYVLLETGKTLAAEQVAAFVESGLKRAKGGPQTFAADLVGQLIKTYLTVRDLHLAMHDAWKRAMEGGADAVAAAHLS